MQLVDFKMVVDLEQSEIAQNILVQLGYNDMPLCIKQCKANGVDKHWLILEDNHVVYDPYVDDHMPCNAREITFENFLNEILESECNLNSIKEYIRQTVLPSYQVVEDVQNFDTTVMHKRREPTTFHFVASLVLVKEGRETIYLDDFRCQSKEEALGKALIKANQEYSGSVIKLWAVGRLD